MKMLVCSNGLTAKKQTNKSIRKKRRANSKFWRNNENLRKVFRKQFDLYVLKVETGG
jgi:hypothetical protein